MLRHGAYLISGRGFFMPSRWDPSIGVDLAGWSARLLGAALLVLAVLGLSALRNFGSGALVRKSPAGITATSRRWCWQSSRWPPH